MKNRIEWLDYIRGISAIFVMLLHFYHMYLQGYIKAVNPSLNFDYSNLPNCINHLQYVANNQALISVSKFILGYVDLGKIGVLMFFAVSGFVIPYSILKYKEFPFVKFLISRFFRLYPIFWFSLISILLINFFSIEHSNLNIFDIFMNFTMFNKYFLIKDLNGVAWTLQIELGFYMLISLLFLTKLLNKNNIIYSLILFFNITSLALSVIRFKTGIETPIAFSNALVIMLLSMQWRKYLLKEDKINLKLLLLVFVTFIISIIPITYLGYGSEKVLNIAGYVHYITTYYIAIFIFVICSKSLNINSKIFSFLGKISYSVYLLHAIIGEIIIKILIKNTKIYLLPHNIGFYLSLLIAISIVLLISSLTYYLIEEKSIKIGKNLIKKFKSNKNENINYVEVQ